MGRKEGSAHGCRPRREVPYLLVADKQGVIPRVVSVDENFVVRGRVEKLCEIILL